MTPVTALASSNLGTARTSSRLDASRCQPSMYAMVDTRERVGRGQIELPMGSGEREPLPSWARGC